MTPHSRGAVLAVLVCFACTPPSGWSPPSWLTSGTTPAAGPAGEATEAAASLPATPLESEVLAALNRARTDPRAFSDTVAALLPFYTGTIVHRPGWSTLESSVEGTPAVHEAVAALQGMSPLEPVVYSEGLSRAARELANDQSHSGQTGHVGSDGSTDDDRVNRYGHWSGMQSESIDYAPDVHGEDVIVNLLIDDGEKDRGHRRNLMDARARVAGIACAPHPKYVTVCVIEMAASYRDRGMSRP